MKLKLALLFLALASLACGLQSQLPTRTDDFPLDLPKSEPVETPDVLDAPISPPAVEITGNVHIRDYAGIVRGSLEAGETVQAWCGFEVCYLADETTIWRGCSDNNPAGLGCEERRGVNTTGRSWFSGPRTSAGI